MTMTTHLVQMVFISCQENGSKGRILEMSHGLGAAEKIWKDFLGNLFKILNCLTLVISFFHIFGVCKFQTCQLLSNL